MSLCWLIHAHATLNFQSKQPELTCSRIRDHEGRCQIPAVPMAVKDTSCPASVAEDFLRDKRVTEDMGIHRSRTNG